MSLKNLVLKKLTAQVVVLSLVFFLAYLLVGATEARALPPPETTPIPPTIIDQPPPAQSGAVGTQQAFNLFLPKVMAAPWQQIIKDREFTRTLHLDAGDDYTLILNATFHDIAGSGIALRNVSNVYIKNCVIYNVTEDGIVLRSTGSTQYITIDGCKIYNIGRSGIHSKQAEGTGIDHANLVIKNNTLYNIGATEYDHGVYIQSKDSVIEQNVIYNTAGNGISMRSSGLVRRNKIWDAQKSCIRYHGNHARGISDLLLVENNLCYQSGVGIEAAGIGLSREETTPEAWLVGTYIIRFNTVVLLTAGRYGFIANSPTFDPRRVEVYGNLFVNTQNLSHTLDPEYVDYHSSNYASIYLQEFVNPAQPLHGFQLRSNSQVRSYASGEPQFPRTDIDGKLRSAGNLDAGAYQSSGQ